MVETAGQRALIIDFTHASHTSTLTRVVNLTKSQVTVESGERFSRRTGKPTGWKKPSMSYVAGRRLVREVPGEEGREFRDRLRRSRDAQPGDYWYVEDGPVA